MSVFSTKNNPIDAQGDADRISPVLSAIGRGVPKQQEFPRLLSHGQMCGVLEPHELLGWGFHVCEPLGCNLGVDINIVAASKDNQASFLIPLRSRLRTCARGNVVSEKCLGSLTRHTIRRNTELPCIFRRVLSSCVRSKRPTTEIGGLSRRIDIAIEDS